MPDDILSISHGFEFDGEGEDAIIVHSWLHVECVAATEMWFDLLDEGLDDDVVLRDLLAIIPVMMRLDSDLAEMYDGAGRTQPKPEDLLAWRRFVNHYQYKTLIVRGDCGLPGCDGWDPFPFNQNPELKLKGGKCATSPMT